jgi:hypothetical protein
MDITALDFFRSKYVLDHPDIMEALDVDTIVRVKNLPQITNIKEMDERKHQEALVLWELIPEHMRIHFTRYFNIWIGNPDSEDTDTEEVKTSTVQKYNRVENKEKTRKITTPIYESKCNDKLVSYLTKKELDNNDNQCVYKLAFDRCEQKGDFNIIWNIIDKSGYNNKSEKQFLDIKIIFSHIPYYNRTIFWNVYSTVMFNVHRVLVGACIYEDYPTFHDYKNIAAHIVLMGKDYCSSVVADPQLIRPLLEYNRFHPVWDYCIKYDG